jgi:hypothetical protein
MPTTPVNNPTGNPFPPKPQPVPAVLRIQIPVPAGDTDLLDPAVIAEEVERGEKEESK